VLACAETPTAVGRALYPSETTPDPAQGNNLAFASVPLLESTFECLSGQVDACR